MQILPTIKLKKRFTEGLVGLMVLFGLLVPFAFVEAAPPTPAPGPQVGVNEFCWNYLGAPRCFATLAACQADGGFASLCRNVFTTQSVAEKVNAKLAGISNGVKKFGEDLLNGTLFVFLKPIEWISQFIFYVAGLFLNITGSLLDMSIDRTINHDTYTNLESVNVGWTIVRDFSNMFFIFALLYISILTIIGSAGSNAKRWVTHLIIAALLINFSLFITQVVIDSGNILAKGFWNKITTVQAGQTVSSVSTKFIQGFRVQTTWDTTNNKMAPNAPKPQPPNITQRILIYLGGAAVMFVAGYVFLAGAIMMIIRTVTLLIVMIVSPFAFLGFALPNGKGKWAGEWLSKLVGATFVAPALVIMLYIDSVIISSTDMSVLGGGTNANFALGLTNSSDNFAIFYQFLVLIILLLASLTVAHKVGNGVGDKAGGWAKTAIGTGGGMAIAGAAMYGRQTLGALGRNQMQNEKWVKEQNKIIARAGMKDAKFSDKVAARFANAKLATVQGASSGTFDLRNAKIGNANINSALKSTGAGVSFGAGGSKSFESGGQVLSSITGGYRGTDKEKEIIETAKKRFPNNPSAQKAYIEEIKGINLAKIEGQVDRNKSVREGLDKEITKKVGEENNKTNFENGLKSYTEHNSTLSKLTKEKEDLEKKGVAATALQVQAIEETTKSIESASEQMKKAMQTMTGADVAKLMNKAEYRDNPAVIENLSAKDYSAINKSYLEGGYKESMGNNDELMMEKITNTALRSEKTPEATKRMIKNAMKNGTWGHEIDFKKEIGSHLTSNASEKELNETWAMLDNDDKADLKEALLDKRIAGRLNGSTLATINKRGNDGAYDDIPEFRKKLEELHKEGVVGSLAQRNNINTAAAYIEKNSGKQDSYFFGMPKTASPTNPNIVKTFDARTGGNPS